MYHKATQEGQQQTVSFDIKLIPSQMSFLGTVTSHCYTRNMGIRQTRKLICSFKTSTEALVVSADGFIGFGVVGLSERTVGKYGPYWNIQSQALFRRSAQIVCLSRGDNVCCYTDLSRSRKAGGCLWIQDAGMLVKSYWLCAVNSLIFKKIRMLNLLSLSYKLC